MTHPHVGHVRAAVDGEGDPAHGIGEIEQERVGAVLLDVGTDAERVLDAAERVEHRPGATVLAVDLTCPVPIRDLEVLTPVAEPAELGTADAVVRTVQRRARIDAVVEDDRSAVGGVELGREPVGPQQPLLVDVVEHEPAPGQLRGVDDVVDHRRAERHASGADQGDLRILHRAPARSSSHPILGPTVDCR